MEQEEAGQFLREQGVGVLALADAGVPYVLPLSFGYDGDARLYFTYLLFGAQSKKEELSERVEKARFLVYAAESMHAWRSVLLTGELGEVSNEEWDELQTAMENAWHPNLFSAATPMRGVKGYQFRITDQTSLKHTGESSHG
jgi:nitroimidazol reductase NimA-like FMN-containing flavoprotein (pyridoxamine 5'-phosphate oxidase superfamily)